MNTNINPVYISDLFSSGANEMGWQKPSPTISLDEWEALLSLSIHTNTCSKFILGDICVYIDLEHGEDALAQLIDEIKIGYHSIKNYKYTSRNVPPQNRFPELSWSHHHIVAKFGSNGEFDKQRELLEMAIDNQWSVEMLKARVSSESQQEESDDDALYNAAISELCFAVSVLIPEKGGEIVELIHSYSDSDPLAIAKMTRGWSNNVGKYLKSILE